MRNPFANPNIPHPVKLAIMQDPSVLFHWDKINNGVHVQENTIAIEKRISDMIRLSAKIDRQAKKSK